MQLYGSHGPIPGDCRADAAKLILGLMVGFLMGEREVWSTERPAPCLGLRLSEIDGSCSAVRDIYRGKKKNPG
jgi:hypothetical protein